ncbi:MAG: hypothetical protein RLZZ410_1137 [Pseudomonadota bacterium]
MPNKHQHQPREIQLRATKIIQSSLVLVMGAFFSLSVLADSKPTAREEMNQEYKNRGIGGKRFEIDRSPMGSFDYYMERLDAAKKKLSITKEQQELWSDYEKSLTTLFADLKRAKARVGGATAVQQVGQVLGVTQNRYAGMEQVYDSAKKLYDSLSDSQKKTADEILITTVPSFD